MKIAFIMDPLEKVKAYKDTTYFIMLAAHERGHQIFYLDQKELFVSERRVFANLTQVEVHADHGHPFSKGETAPTDLGEMDVVMIRTDPPFDRAYFYATLLLDFLPATTRVLNRPSGLRNWNEKLATLYFSDFMPATLVTRDGSAVKDFMNARGGRITLKPIDGHGGRGVVFLEPGDINLDHLIDSVTRGGRHWVIVQEYVPAAKLGDKRILLLNGEPMGAILRVHAAGKELNNLDAGATAVPAELSERDRAVCTALKPALEREGLFFVGIDMLGDYLIEINVTSPTGLREMSNFADIPYHHHIIEALEKAG